MHHVVRCLQHRWAHVVDGEDGVKRAEHVDRVCERTRSVDRYELTGRPMWRRTCGLRLTIYPII